MEKRSPCGSGGCFTCPFSETDEAIQLYNLACLPSQYDIIKIKEKSGHNWECHSDKKVLCGGYARFIQEYRPDLSVKTGNLISFDTWYHNGEETAIQEADAKSQVFK